MTDTIESLTAEYRARIAEAPEYRPNMSADEALHEVLDRRDCYDREAVYLRAFLERWEKAEQAERDDARKFEAWRTGRKWFHDLRDSCESDERTGPGYLYPNGFWIRLNTEATQEIGRYWTLCPFDLWGDLETCERALWAEYGRG